MRECARMIKAEFYKMRGTLFFPFHVLLPCFGAHLFLAYYGYHDFAAGKEWAWYIEAVSIVYPVMISMVCAIAIGIEEKNHFFVLLGTAVHRKNSLLAKWTVLSVTGFFAVIMAVGGFFAVWQMTGHERGGFGKLCLLTILILWIASWSMYLFHLYLCLRWSGNISMCVGVLQSLLAALLQTGLGDGIWQFFLCAFGGRWSSYLLLYFYAHGGTDFRMSFGSGLAHKIMLPAGLLERLAVSVGVMAVWNIGVFAGFHFFEGRHLND